MKPPRRSIRRREFLKWGAALVGGAALGCGTGTAGGPPLSATKAARLRTRVPDAAPRKLIFVAVDSLDPRTLSLDSRGLPNGSAGNWLMPNVRAFVERSAWFPGAKSFLPAATDMNHVNALAGTNSGQTGLLGVYAQPYAWGSDGRLDSKPTPISMARDDRGRPVDTLFHAWKRRWPDSRTAFVSGKGWVAEKFRGTETPSVDRIITGRAFPSYLSRPWRERFADPPTDADAACDPESRRPPLRSTGGEDRGSDFVTGLCQGQGGFTTRLMERHPDLFPHDAWIVDAALEVFAREDPGMAYILMAQTDDAGHCLGAAWDTAEFVTAVPRYVPPKGCADDPAYQWVSSRNGLLYREAVLDAVRDTDIQFGRLMAGLRELGALENATVVLLSDHSMINHLRTAGLRDTDCLGLLRDAGLAREDEVVVLTVCSYALLYWRDRKGVVPDARALLEAHRARNGQTGQAECPWWVLDREAMRGGVPGICGPGEFYHPYFIDATKERTVVWPDLIVLARNGWQLPVYAGRMPNTGTRVPAWMPPFLPFNGGHGSVDTLPIVAAIAAPGGKSGIRAREVRIADLAVTAASLFGLEIRSPTVGADLTRELA